MSEFSTKKLLSPPRRQLLELMQRYSFCKIESLIVLNGEPAFHPPPLVTEVIKIGGCNGPRKELDLDDFALRASVIELFECLQRIENGRVALIEVLAGQPVRICIERPVSGERT